MIFFQFIINSVKYKRNKLLIDIIAKQSKIMKLRMVLIYRAIKFNAEYTTILKEVNELEQKQIFKYDTMIEYDINILMDKLNAMNCDTFSINVEIDVLEADVNKLSESLRSVNNMVRNYASYNQYLNKKNTNVIDIGIDYDLD